MLKSATKKKIITEIAGSEKNTGAADVQVALLTEKINEVNNHMRANKHDFSAQRGLLKNIGQRKRLLRYLKNNNFEKYQAILAKLGLRE